MARGGIITLYVGNLPEKLHWCGLRQAFRRHGDLVDAYIAKKLDRQGKLFGFVRYSKMWDARRAMESLNGFKIFGFRLVVFLARYNARTSYWKKQKVVPQSLNQSRAEGIEERNVAIESHMLEEAGKVAVNGNNRGCKKISGFVDNETLWMLEIHSVRLIHKGAGDDSKKEPVRSESIDSSSSSASTTPSKKLKSQNLNLNGEEILRLTKLLEKGELDLANFIKDLKGNNSRSTSQKLEKISNLAIAPKKYLCINAHFEQPGDNVVASQNPIQERISDDILAMGFVRDEAQIEEEVGDFEVGDGELYGSEGKGVANISPGQKEKEIPNSMAAIRRGHKTPNLATLKEKALASSYQNFLMDLGADSFISQLQAQEELLACFVLEAYVDFGYGQIWRLIAYCGVARSRKEVEVRLVCWVSS
ncbi:hypothetical protein V6N11_058077 [Hibiscus sabdariffa]|uniref:RRM domain-containing protein n=1 Tax=Hibiscus sabdariffa TaxID=183260 RepID=A0ABR1ZBY1_9ROSI